MPVSLCSIISGCSPDEVAEALRQSHGPGWHVVHLDRPDILAQSVSDSDNIDGFVTAYNALQSDDSGKLHVREDVEALRKAQAFDRLRGLLGPQLEQMMAFADIIREAQD